MNKQQAEAILMKAIDGLRLTQQEYQTLRMAVQVLRTPDAVDQAKTPVLPIVPKGKKEVQPKA